MVSERYSKKTISNIDDVLKYYPTIITLCLPFQTVLDDRNKCLIDKEHNVWLIEKTLGNEEIRTKIL